MTESDPLLTDPEPVDGVSPRAARAAIALMNSANRVVREGVGPITGSAAWAESRLRAIQGDRYVNQVETGRRGIPTDDCEKTIDRLVAESVAAAASAGFLTGLGGFITLPITLPANVAGALIINVRLAGAIAYLRGYELEDPHTQSMIPLVALGSNVQSALSAIGAQVGIKLTQQALKKLPIELLRRVNQRLGFMLLAKYGTKRAAITLVKGIPFVGGVVGGAVDAGLTAIVGHTARRLFKPLV